MPPKAVHKYSVGDLVFAKVKGYPPWPARVEKDPPPGYKAGPGRYPVFFFGTYESAVVNGRDLSPYEQNKVKLGVNRKLKNFNEGLEEIANNPNIQVSVGLETQTMDTTEVITEPEAEEPPKEADNEMEEPMETSVESPTLSNGDELSKKSIEPKVKPESKTKTESKPKTKAELKAKAEPKPKAESKAKSEPKIKSGSKTKAEPNVKAGAEVMPELEIPLETKIETDSDEDEKKLVIDDQPVSAGKKKKRESNPIKKKSVRESFSALAAKRKPEKSTGRGAKRKRVVLDDSSASDAEKAEESVDVKSVGADKESSEAEKLKTLNKDSSAESEDSEVVLKRVKRQKKEKIKTKSKDEKRRRKERKVKDKEPEQASSGEPEVEDPEVVEKLRLKLQESKDKEKEIQQKLQEKEREKERRKQEKKEQKRKEKMEKSTKVPPPVAEVLQSIDSDIQNSLSKECANVDRCLEAMERLKSVQVTAQGLQTYGSVLKELILTLKKCRKYKTDERVRQKSDHLFHKFKDFFYTNDSTEMTDSLSLNTTSTDTNSTDTTSADTTESKADIQESNEIKVNKTDDNLAADDTIVDQMSESTAVTAAAVEPIVATEVAESRTEEKAATETNSSTTGAVDVTEKVVDTENKVDIMSDVSANNTEGNGILDAQAVTKATVEHQNGVELSSTAAAPAVKEAANGASIGEDTENSGPKVKSCLVM